MALDPRTWVESSGLTDTGRCRNQNEDAILVAPECGLFLVADGVGGLNAGETASSAIVEAVRTAFLSDDSRNRTVVTAKGKMRIFRNVLDRTSRWIFEQSRQEGWKGAASTVVALFLDEENPSVAKIMHAGDSPVLLYRAGRLNQLTADHALDAWVTDPAQKKALSGVITRAVGIKMVVELEETEIGVQADDILLICSDGLTRMLPPPQLTEVFYRYEEQGIDCLATELVNAANEAGGKDNISVILVRIDHLPQPRNLEEDDSEVTQQIDVELDDTIH